MTNNHQNVVDTQVMAEQQQGHETRKKLFGGLEELLGNRATDCINCGTVRD